MIPAAQHPRQPPTQPSDAHAPVPLWRTPPVVQPPTTPRRWQQAWRDAIRDPRELLQLLGLDDQALRISDEAAAAFPMRVPRAFAARMRHADANDPLLRQVLPLDAELRQVEGFGLDAVGDAAAKAGHGVIHKYQGRALLVATGSCAVNCRYCFRRHFPYAEETAAAAGWQAAVQVIADDPSLHEVILSGGDPLSLATPKLVELTDTLRTITHVRRLRIHTRLPIVLPERVDDEFRQWLASLPWPVAIVVHANHANEFDPGVDAAVQALRACGATVLNQAVLLRGVNDDVDSLCALSERSFQAGVIPYYLHQLDRVAGAAHFEISDDRARQLHAGLLASLPGYLVPRLVREVAGDTSKRPL